MGRDLQFCGTFGFPVRKRSCDPDVQAVAAEEGGISKKPDMRGGKIGIVRLGLTVLKRCACMDRALACRIFQSELMGVHHDKIHQTDIPDAVFGQKRPKLFGIEKRVVDAFDDGDTDFIELIHHHRRIQIGQNGVGGDAGVLNMFFLVVVLEVDGDGICPLRQCREGQ